MCLSREQKISRRLFQQLIMKVTFGEQDSQLGPLEKLGRKTFHGSCIYYVVITHLVLLFVYVM